MGNAVENAATESARGIHKRARSFRGKIPARVAGSELRTRLRAKRNKSHLKLLDTYKSAATSAAAPTASQFVAAARPGFPGGPGKRGNAPRTGFISVSSWEEGFPLARSHQQCMMAATVMARRDATRRGREIADIPRLGL